MDALYSDASVSSCSFEGLEEDLGSSLSVDNDSKDSSPLGWPLGRQEEAIDVALQDPYKLTGFISTTMWEEKRERRDTQVSEVELMKEKFARLLLGEDMSGGGRGVCTALAISNSITNLSASVFGELWRLEPFASERKMMWRREMEWLLSVTDHIVELIPQWQKCPDGNSIEVMISTPRSDLHINLPALRKLDAMLLDTLDSFTDTEFWYSDRASAATETNQETRRASLKEKWWLPTPLVPANGLSDELKRRLQQQREATNQILKAAMALNAQVLSEMEVPGSYIECLPKNGKTSLGELVYRNICSEKFSPDILLSSLNLSTELVALELANSIEIAIHVWLRKIQNKQVNTMPKEDRVSAKSSWVGIIKEPAVDTDKRRVFVDRAETLLRTLKQRFPGLPQTLLDSSKIQFNRDVGQSILESYSRVLESLAFNILSRIDDVLHADASRNNSAPISSPAPTCHSVLIPKNISVLARSNSLGATPDLPSVATMELTPPVKLSIQTPTTGTITNVSSATNTLANHMKIEALIKQGSLHDSRLQKSNQIEMNNWSHACSLDNGKVLHSPPGRD